MTNEKMLEMIYTYRELRATDPAGAEMLLLNTRTILEEQLRQDCMKKKGLGKRDKLIQKIMKAIDTVRDRACGRYGYHDCEGGLYGFCDGFRIYATTDTYGHLKAESQLKPDELLPKNKDTTLTQIDLADVQLFIRAQKAEKAAARKAKKVFKPKPYVVNYAEGKRVGFTAEYLLEFCQFFNTTEIGVYDELTGCTYHDNETGEWGWLLPCRIREGQ